MARPVKRRVVKNETVDNNSVMETVVDDSEMENVTEDSPVEEEKEISKPSKKKWEKNDSVLCHSIMTGGTYMEGIKTKKLYVFESFGASDEVEYQDLVAAINTNSAFVFLPMIIIDDEEFIQSNARIKKFYNDMYSPKDLSKILNLSISNMVEILPKLPLGAQESLKSIATTKIANGTLDSVSKIKALDDFFGTQMMLLTGLYDDE